MAVAGIVLPSPLGVDMMDGGYAIGLVSLMLLITALIVALVYWRRAVAMNAILSGEDHLAHWRYDSATWARHVDSQFADVGKRNRSTFLLLTAISLGIGVLFLIVAPDGGNYVFAAMIALIAVCGAAAVITPWLQRRSNLAATPEAYIGRRGAIVGSDLHLWRTAGTRLEDVSVEPGMDQCLVVTYSAAQRHGRQEYVVSVPVPPGEEDSAAQVVAALQSADLGR